MQAIWGALGPVFMMVMLGWGLRRLAFPGPEFWPLVERFTYYLLFPALLVHKLATADFSAVAVAKVGLGVLLLLGLGTLLLYLWQRFRPEPGPVFTSVYQGGIRFNTYVGLAAAEQLFGAQGLAVAALIMAVMIPTVNVLCVLVFARYGSQQAPGWRQTLQQLLRNPLILACVLGMLLNASGLGLPGWSADTLAILGQAALPLGLLAVGVAIDLRALQGASAPLLVSSICKFIAMPLLAWLLAWGLQLGELSSQLLVVFAALPTASSAYILARQLGGAAPLMANIITLQTLAAMLALPLWLALLLH
ncbi:AEC family transporter [Balneatrix alpica]|uniref:AEC family transporter n=1 Tax=Balneatrix alpica TaxID=75684 RepID=A0ABV5ZEX8_9GAMM|nr:AEC family transporter [Balneatrix alpica]